MKLLHILILVTILFSCSQKESTLTELYELPQFKIDSNTYDVDFYPRGMEEFNGKIILHTFGALQVYDKQMVIDSALNGLLNDGLPSFNNLWVSNDTIYTSMTRILKQGEKKGIWTGSVSINYWTRQNANWKALKTFDITNKEWGIENQLIPAFEDDKYIIRYAHRGEWGGSIYFTNKKTGRVYSTEANYVVGIHKMNGSYIVVSTSTVPEMKILEVNDPEDMYDLTESSDRYNCAWHTVDLDTSPYYLNLEGYDKGVQILLDSFDLWCTASFQYENQLFCVYSDMEQTYLGHFRNGELTPIDTIINERTYYLGSRNLVQNPHFFPIVSRNYNGFIKLRDSILTINKFKGITDSL